MPDPTDHRARYMSDLMKWVMEDEAKRRAELRDVATRCGIAGGRPWSRFTDEEIARLWRAVFAADYRSDEEFDATLPF